MVNKTRNSYKISENVILYCVRDSISNSTIAEYARCLL